MSLGHETRARHRGSRGRVCQEAGHGHAAGVWDMVGWNAVSGRVWHGCVWVGTCGKVGVGAYLHGTWWGARHGCGEAVGYECAPVHDTDSVGTGIGMWGMMGRDTY